MEPEREGQGPSREPSVMDWFKSLLRGRPLAIPSKPGEPPPVPSPVVVEAVQPEPVVGVRRGLRITASKLRLPIALLLAFMGQFGLELRVPGIKTSIAFYILAAGLMGWAVWAGDLPDRAPAPIPGKQAKKASNGYRPVFLVLAAILAVMTFFASADNLFTSTTIVVWVGALICVLLGLWEGSLSPLSALRRLRGWLRAPRVRIELDAWAILVLAALAVCAYFRFWRLASIIPEMVSDQAEKLLDVADVLSGHYLIFFERNTGREALQFYLAAATARLLGTGLTFDTLKIGTITLGFLTLPFIYMFGNELGGRRAGLAAMALAGIAYWPNIISRVGLRFTLYPALAAPALAFLARGLRLRRRNDLLLCGLAMGIGLHGYSPFRVVPLAVALGVILFLLHRETRGERWAFVGWLAAAGAVAVVVSMPLLRAAVDMPDLVLFRQMTRLGSLERPLPGPPLLIFLGNQWNALRMFGWDNGPVWVIVIPGRPALDWVTGALFHLGVAGALVRYIRKRKWLDLFVLLLIPVLMLPSSLSLAFPEENPATNRAGAAIVPAFALAGMTLATISEWAEAQWRGRGARSVAVLAAIALFALAARNNYRLVFIEHDDLYRRSAWNTSDMGRVVRGFADSIGSTETAYLVGYPFWADSRLVAIHAGDPTHDIAIMPESLDLLAGETRPLLFLVNSQDTATIDKLRSLFPDGRLSMFDSPYEGQDFFIYLVPGQQDPALLPTPVPET